MKNTLKTKLQCQNKIPENLIECINRSFEIIGDIAIIEIDKKLEKYQNEIAKTCLKTNRAIKTVLKKDGIHKTEFRTQNLEFIKGEKKFETKYKENGIELFVNPKEVYFSSKLSKEREILFSKDLTKKNILIMFSGLGPYTFVALRKNPNIHRIDSIELNPKGHKLALKNLELNKNILKKSNLFISVIKFLRENKIYIKEKELIENLNSLKIHFFNEDVKKQTKNLNLKKYKVSGGNVEFLNKEFLKINTGDLFEYLNKKNLNSINIDLDNFKLELFREVLIYILIYFQKKKFFIKLNNKYYYLKNNFSKSVFLDFLCLKQKNIENNILYDEIFMPLPKDACHFLDSTLPISKKGTIIHMYDFIYEKDFPKKTENKVIDFFKKNNKKIKIINTRKVGQYSPRKYRVCCDFEILE
jgi:tRNA G37 N-methylase Trm5